MSEEASCDLRPPTERDGSASGIILAGGQGSRLGRDKTLLRFGSDRPLIEEIISLLTPLCDEILVVVKETKRYNHPAVRVVGDVFPNAGALGGIYSGLLVARNRRGLVVACDMPFLNVDLLRYMLGFPDDHDVIVPRHGSGFVETLHAIYSRNCLGAMRACLESGRRRIVDLFPAVKVRYIDEPDLRRIDPELLSFFNVNTPEQMQQALAMHLRGSGGS